MERECVRAERAGEREEKKRETHTQDRNRLGESEKKTARAQECQSLTDTLSPVLPLKNLNKRTRRKKRKKILKENECFSV